MIKLSPRLDRGGLVVVARFAGGPCWKHGEEKDEHEDVKNERGYVEQEEEEEEQRDVGEKVAEPWRQDDEESE